MPGRSGDDVYLAYTGGTTGQPKGVVWRHEDIFFAAMGGGDPTTALGPIGEPDELVDRIIDPGIVMLCAPPLVHVERAVGPLPDPVRRRDRRAEPPGSIEPGAVWSAVAPNGVNVLTVVGDAMARPLLDDLAAHPDRDDLGTLLVFASGGAVLSPSSKEQIAALLPGVITVDGYGSTETGVSGARARLPGTAVDDTTRFPPSDSLRVVDDDFRPIEPGSGAIGQLVRCGRLPLGYHHDPEKTAATFVTVDGVRWARSGDAATVDADGTIVLLGRGSVSINTGGEKVYPEEVEQVLKDHPAVFDAVVVGAPDRRGASGSSPIVAPATPAHALTLDDLRSHGRRPTRGLQAAARARRGRRRSALPDGQARLRMGARDRHLRTGRDLSASAQRRGHGAAAHRDRDVPAAHAQDRDRRPVRTRRSRPRSTPSASRCATPSRASSPCAGRRSGRPFDLAHPAWIDGPVTDLDRHLHHVTLGAPGGRRELCAVVSTITETTARPGSAAVGDLVRRRARRRTGRLRRQDPPRARRRRREWRVARDRVHDGRPGPTGDSPAPSRRDRPRPPDAVAHASAASSPDCARRFPRLLVHTIRAGRRGHRLRRTRRPPGQAKPFAGPHTRLDAPLTAPPHLRLRDLRARHHQGHRPRDRHDRHRGRRRRGRRRAAPLPHGPRRQSSRPRRSRPWSRSRCAAPRNTTRGAPTSRRGTCRSAPTSRIPSNGCGPWRPTPVRHAAELEATDPQLQHDWAEYWRLFRAVTLGLPRVVPALVRPAELQRDRLDRARVGAAARTRTARASTSSSRWVRSSRASV